MARIRREGGPCWRRRVKWQKFWRGQEEDRCLRDTPYQPREGLQEDIPKCWLVRPLSVDGAVTDRLESQCLIYTNPPHLTNIEALDELL